MHQKYNDEKVHVHVVIIYTCSYSLDSSNPIADDESDKGTPPIQSYRLGTR